MKKTFIGVILVCVLLLSLALIREHMSANVMRGFYLQAIESEAKWAYSYGRVLNDTNLSSDDKLQKLRLVNEAEIPPVSAQLDSFTVFGRKVPDVREQLFQIEKLSKETANTGAENNPIIR